MLLLWGVCNRFLCGISLYGIAVQIYCCDGTAAEVLLALPGAAVESKTNFQKGTIK